MSKFRRKFHNCPAFFRNTLGISRIIYFLTLIKIEYMSQSINLPALADAKEGIMHYMLYPIMACHFEIFERVEHDQLTEQFTEQVFDRWVGILEFNQDKIMLADEEIRQLL